MGWEGKMLWWIKELFSLREIMFLGQKTKLNIKRLWLPGHFMWHMRRFVRWLKTQKFGLHLDDWTQRQRYWKKQHWTDDDKMNPSTNHHPQAHARTHHHARFKNINEVSTTLTRSIVTSIKTVLADYFLKVCAEYKICMQVLYCFKILVTALGNIRNECV